MKGKNMTLTIKITMDNAAFEAEQSGPEAARILKQAAETIYFGNMGMKRGARMLLRDLNGNIVGEARVTR